MLCFIKAFPMEHSNMAEIQLSWVLILRSLKMEDTVVSWTISYTKVPRIWGDLENF